MQFSAWPNVTFAPYRCLTGRSFGDRRLVHITRMVQLSLGVVDAVPEERRAQMAEERLLLLSSEERFRRVQLTPHDELSEAAAEILVNIDRLYYEGRLDAMLCGLPTSNPAADPLKLLEKISSHLSVDIGVNNYSAMATTCLEAVAAWAQANPNLDGGDPAPPLLTWERHSDRAALDLLDASIDERSDVVDDPSDDSRPTARSGWNLAD